MWGAIHASPRIKTKHEEAHKQIKQTKQTSISKSRIGRAEGPIRRWKDSTASSAGDIDFKRLSPAALTARNELQPPDPPAHTAHRKTVGRDRHRGTNKPAIPRPSCFDRSID